MSRAKKVGLLILCVAIPLGLGLVFDGIGLCSSKLLDSAICFQHIATCHSEYNTFCPFRRSGNLLRCAAAGAGFRRAQAASKNPF